MKHLGDISKINGATIAPVDIITFGSPCQDLSIAGKQEGLDGNRSGLFREAVRIIKEMRDATNGQQPRFAIWENVPGAYSSNNKADFQTVLHELCKVTEPKAPLVAIPKAGWPSAGQLANVGGGSIAYRTINAQFHGVPQRRRRIILVCDFTGQCAGDLLFKPRGLPGYPAQGVCKGQTFAGASVVSPDPSILCFAPGGASRLGGHVWENVAGTLLAKSGDNRPTIVIQGNMIGRSDKSATDRHAAAIENHPSDSRIKINENNTVQTLTERMGTGGGNVPLVMQEE